MTFKEFEEGILIYKESIEYTEKLADLGVDLFETKLIGSNDYFFDRWLNSNFNDEGVDLVYWWLFEDVSKIIYNEDDSKTSVETLEDLFNYLSNGLIINKD